MTQMEIGTVLKINGQTFTVAAAQDGFVSVVGKRGGERALVQNARSGRWSLCDWRRTVPVQTLEVVQ